MHSAGRVRRTVLAHALDVCKTENQTRDTTHGGARRKAPSPACPKRPFTTHADRLRPRLKGGRLPGRGGAGRGRCTTVPLCKMSGCGLPASGWLGSSSHRIACPAGCCQRGGPAYRIHPDSRCPKSNASGWSSSARISADSTTRGPGQLKYWLPSVTNTRPARTADSCDHSGPPRG